MPIQIEVNKGRVPVKIYTDEIEPQALQQLINISQLPIIHSHVAAMPDVHLGIGATVGSVIPTKQAIIPAAVGVDIGCGMNALRLSLKASQLPHNLNRIRSAIEAAVPVGFAQHKDGEAAKDLLKPLQPRLQKIIQKHPIITSMMRRWQDTWTAQMGSLGSGNHFIELCIDESQDVWVRSEERRVGKVSIGSGWPDH